MAFIQIGRRGKTLEEALGEGAGDFATGYMQGSQLEEEKQRRQEALEYERQKALEAQQFQKDKIAMDYLQASGKEIPDELAQKYGLRALADMPYTQKKQEELESKKIEKESKGLGLEKTKLEIEQLKKDPYGLGKIAQIERVKTSLEQEKGIREASQIPGVVPIKQDYTADDLKEAKSTIATRDELIKSAKDLKNTLSKTGTTYTKDLTKSARDLSAAISKVQLPLKEFEKLGVLAGPDMGILESEIGKLQGMAAGGLVSKQEAMDRVQKLVDYVQDRASARLQARGFQPKQQVAQQAQQLDPKKQRLEYLKAKKAGLVK